MTAYTASNIPTTTANTLEKIYTLLSLAMYNAYKGQTYQESNGSAIDSGLAPKIDVSVVSTADGNQRMIVRSSIALNPAYLSNNTLPLWAFAESLGSAEIPAAFKA